MEHWKDIEGYDGMYQVSDLGNVRSLDRINSYGRFVKGRPRKQFINNATGYCYVNLSKGGKVANLLVHRLVALAFVENPNGKPTVNHINENKQDNRAQNLEWMTLPENLQYGTHNERSKKNRVAPRGKDHPAFGKFGGESRTSKGKVIGVRKDDPSVIVEFDSAASAARGLGLSTGQLCEAINGKAKSCGGYYWRRCNGS